MLTERPREVTAYHLAGMAGIYRRQSSDHQTKTNTGSMEYQRGQERWALAWGWAADQIQSYVDAGLSGTAAAHRPGFLRMLEDIRQGRLRIVFASDQSRLARNAVEWINFLSLCRIHRALLVLNGRVVQVGDDSDAFGSSIIALVDEFENRRRRAVFEKGKLGKIAGGKAVSAPPTGYVARKDGSWELDPDQDVQAGVQEVFRVFLEERSSARTVRRLIANGRRLPRRRTGREVQWRPPTVRAVLGFVSNGVYDGHYIFRRRVVDEARGRDRRGHFRIRTATPDEQIRIPNHHPAYISAREAEEIAAILAANRPAKNRRQLGPGASLLQGIIRCARHDGRAMSVDYRGLRSDGRERAHIYHCHGDYEAGGSQCWTPAGRQLDRAVAQAVFARLAEPELVTVRSEWEAARSESLRRDAGDALVVAHARRRVDELTAKFDNVNPSLRHLSEHLEAELDKALGDLKRLEAAKATASGEDEFFTDQTFGELIELCRDLPALFYADTTAHRDRKEIIRLLVEKVSITNVTRETISFAIVWADGSEPTRGEAHLARHAHALIKQWAAEGVKNPEIARKLNEMGLKTSRGRHWTTATVWQVQDYEFRTPVPPMRKRA